MGSIEYAYAGKTMPYDYDLCSLKDNRHIRILEVFPGNKDEQIECALKARPFADAATPEDPAVAYETLSYAWTDEDPTEPILVHTENGPYTCKVATNLLTALKILRLPEGSGRRNFWIDAMCMNQKRLQEKNHQVTIMSNIYKEATGICVWLGNASNDSKNAITFLKGLRVESFDRAASDDYNDASWAAFSNLMKRPWFNRRWSVQEIVFAARAKLYCGEDSIDWKTFQMAVALFNFAEDRDRTFSEKLGKSQVDIQPLAAIRLVSLVGNLFSTSGPKKIQQKLPTLEAIVSDMTAFDSQDPRDVLYSVLDLAANVLPVTEIKYVSEKVDKPRISASTLRIIQEVTHEMKQRIRRRFLVDYERPFFHVCKDFLEFVFARSQSLDIICSPWVPEEAKFDKERPSWLRTTAVAPYRSQRDWTLQRAHADSLVGLPGRGRQSYDASPPMAKLLEYSFAEGDNYYSLNVQGFVVDKVKQANDGAIEGNIPSPWLEIGDWVDQSSDPPEALWRTLVGDRDPEGLNPPDHWSDTLSAALSQSVQGGTISTRILLENTKTGTSIREFLYRVQEVIWNRMLIKSQHGNLGLAPAETQVGDLICVLLGCSVPIILRSLHQRPGKQKAPYVVIGECYVHGLMDGEAADIACEETGRNPIEWFELR